jgi:hypothetical protein
MAVFDYSTSLIPLVGEAGFGLVITEGRGMKKIVAVGRKSDLVGKAREWNLPYENRLDFEPEKAVTVGGWFCRSTLTRSGNRPDIVKSV